VSCVANRPEHGDGMALVLFLLAVEEGLRLRSQRSHRIAQLDLRDLRAQCPEELAHSVAKGVHHA
jgi:hypothetical protein